MATQDERPTEAKGLTRRSFLRKSLWGAFFLLTAEGLAATLTSLWPKVKASSLGSKIALGEVADFPIGSITHFPNGQFFISRVESGLLAMNHICPHLGCVVPWRPDEQSEDNLAEKRRFNCPCHVSIFDRYGQVISGPSPRPLDLNPLTLEGGKLTVDTGVVIKRQSYEESQVLKV